MSLKSKVYLTIIVICLIGTALLLRAGYNRRHPPGTAPRNMVMLVTRL